MPCPIYIIIIWLAPLPSPPSLPPYLLVRFTMPHICVNYLHVEGQGKEVIAQCGIASHVSL